MRRVALRGGAVWETRGTLVKGERRGRDTLCSKGATWGPHDMSPVSLGSQPLGPETVESGTSILRLNPHSILPSRSLPSLCWHTTPHPTPGGAHFTQCLFESLSLCAWLCPLGPHRAGTPNL